MDIERLAQKARKSISRYCIEECKAYCCRKGYLILDSVQLKLVMQNRQDELKDLVKEIKKGSFSMYMGNSKQPCPSLNEKYECIIHKKKNRPQACKEFPLFIKGKKIILSPRCLAVKEGKFYPYIIKFKELGYKILNTSCLEHIDTLNTK